MLSLVLGQCPKLDKFVLTSCVLFAYIICLFNSIEMDTFARTLKILYVFGRLCELFNYFIFAT